MRAIAGRESIYGAIVVALTSAVGCGGDTGAASAPIGNGTPSGEHYSLVLSTNAVTLAVGTTTAISAVVRNASGAAVTTSIAWVSNYPNIASVDAGTVTAHEAGTATISASAFDATASAQITVPPPPPVTLRGTGTIYISGQAEPFPGGPFNDEILTFDAQTGAQTNITHSPTNEQYPEISPSGQYVAYDLVIGGTLRVTRRDNSTVAEFPVFTACDGRPTVTCTSVRTWLSDDRLTFIYGDNAGQSIRILTPSTRAVQTLAWPSRLSTSTSSLVLAPAGTAAVFLSPVDSIVAIRLSTGVATALAPACKFPSTCNYVFAWSPAGTTLYAARDGAILAAKIDGSGTSAAYTATSGAFSGIAVSPDGTQIAFVEGSVLKVLRLSDHTVTSLAPAFGGSLAWSPDSKSIAYGNGPQVLAINADGTGTKAFTRLPAFATVNGISWTK